MKNLQALAFLAIIIGVCSAHQESTEKIRSFLKDDLVHLVLPLVGDLPSEFSHNLKSTGVNVSFTNVSAQFAAQPPLVFSNSMESGIPTATSAFLVNDQQQYQTILGFGAALTDSSAYLINNLPANLQSELLLKLFDAQSGIGISYIRLPISVCDFSLSNYTYDNMPTGQTDPNLTNFSINHDKAYIIPIIKKIMVINPQLKIVVSPWTPPAWMKNTDCLLGTCNGVVSNLLPQFYQAHANYLVKVVQAYLAEGINIHTLTIQNEPGYGPDSYPGMVMDQFEQADYINNYLAPAYAANNITNAKILVWDHNWDTESYPDYVLGNLTKQAQQYVYGAAFHCYYGDVSNQTVLHNKYPNYHIFQTECSGENWPRTFTPDFIEDMQTILIGAVNNWAEISLKWNLVLDMDLGPQNNGCPNCVGLAMINTTTNQIQYIEDYYAIGVMSKFIRPGAKRIGLVSQSKSLIATCVINPDTTHAFVVMNTDVNNAQQFVLTWKQQYLQATVPPATAAVYTW